MSDALKHWSSLHHCCIPGRVFICEGCEKARNVGNMKIKIEKGMAILNFIVNNSSLYLSYYKTYRYNFEKSTLRLVSIFFPVMRFGTMREIGQLRKF
jgi:hypothetical protein